MSSFFGVFARYNAAVWPAPIVAYVLGIAAVVAALSVSRAGNYVAAAALALFWTWTGVAYHWLAFAVINQAAWLFGALYIIEAMLLLWFGRQLCFGYRRGFNGIVGLLLIVYAAIIYPVLGYAAGHSYPATPIFGVTPCPVAIFTLGLFLLARRPPWVLLIVPVLWSLVGGTAAFLLHVPQDWLLLVSGPLVVILLWRVRAGAAD